MKKLYQPIMLNKLQLKNRIMMAPCGINNTVDGCMTDQDVAFYRKRAAGGVAVIVVANLQWDKIRFNPNSGAHIIDKKSIPSLKKVTDAVHEEGGKIFAQLVHMGRYAKQIKNQGMQSVAPSAIPSKFTQMEMPRELTREEIKEFVQWQAEAAANALEAGFDGIEIETNSGYLFGQFFSPLTNKRTDEYGGDIHGRTRFFIETLTAVRKVIGPDVPLTIRVGGNDFVPGSCNSDDIADICELVDRTGLIDGISVTGGWHEASVPLVTMELPHGAYAYLGRGIKARVKVPVMMGNRMNVEKAEELVERGDVDMVVMGRPLFADPDLPKKAMNGKIDTIRPCIGCNAGCLDSAMHGVPAGCIGNPEANRETNFMDENGKLPTETKSASPEKILVIGAGPAGLEFARVAALRGNTVTVWEKRNRTIGLSMLAATPPRRYDIRYIGQWLERTCRALGVEFVLSQTATTENILEAVKTQGFDRVVLACGSNSIMPKIPIEEGAYVVQAWDVLEGKAEVGKEIVVIGGGAVGVETAEYIGEIGTLSAEELRFMMIFDAEPHDKLKYLLNHGSKKVSIVEMQPRLAPDINPSCRWSIMTRVRQLGIEMYNSSTVTAIKKNGVCISNEDGEHFVPADTMVIAVGARPNNDMLEELKKHVEKVDTIGDATTVAKIPEAIGAGYRLAASI